MDTNHVAAGRGGGQGTSRPGGRRGRGRGRGRGQAPNQVANVAENNGSTNPRGGGRGNHRGAGGGRGNNRGGRGSQGGSGAANANANQEDSDDSDVDFGDLNSMISKRRKYGKDRIWPVGLNQMQMLLGEPEQVVLLTLQDPKFGFKELLEQEKIPTQALVLAISLLHRASAAADRCPTNIMILFNACLSSTLFTVHVPRFLTSAPFEMQRPGTLRLPVVLGQLVELFDKLLAAFPHKASESLGVVFLTCRNVVEQMEMRGTPVDAATSAKLTALGTLRTDILARYDDKGLTERAKEECAQAKPPPDDFRAMSRTPTLADVHEIIHPFLRPNIVGGRYADAEHYLDVHFRLIREDFVAPLRDGLNNLLSLVALNGQGAQAQRAKGRAARELNVKVYDQVRVVAMECCSRDGIINVLRFSLRGLTRVRWEATKRLLHGSLVCLSADNFLSMRLAVIVRRDPVKLKNGILNVRFLRDTDGWSEPSAREEFTMVESPAYFEAYEPILRGLQLQDGALIPFSRYIIEGEKLVDSPRYLTPQTVYDLRPLLIPELRTIRNTAATCRISDPTAWPSAEDFGLDAAQYSALRLGLTNELALVQGPPGTGKTFLGLKMVEALLYNHQAWSGVNQQPILVICFTNHALDQFLEGILAMYKNGSLVQDLSRHTVVRVGGQSKCEALKAYNLSELRRSLSNERNIPGFVHGNRKRKLWNLNVLQLDIEEQMHLMQTAETRILNEWFLESQMSPRHYDQFLDYDWQLDQWNRRGPKKGRSAIMDWLGVAEGCGLDQRAAEEVMAAQAVADANEEEDHGDELSEEEDPTAEDEIGRRLVDDDNTFFVANHRSRMDAQRHAQRRARMDRQCFATFGDGNDNETSDADEWQVQGGRKRMQKHISSRIRGAAAMTQEESQRVLNIWRLNIDDRWRLYRLWMQKLRTQRIGAVEHLKVRYVEEQKSLLEVQRELDIHILRDAKIIGMTTTGAAKHHEILKVIAPRIVVVEEAAEVLEAHIITALTEDCQHLILIGDQQQLRPSPTVYKLAKDFHLDVSLFERLIANGVAYECLSQQHRMRPEISALLVPHIYPNLRNHASVEKREHIRGVANDVFFLSHGQAESAVADTTSRENLFEAKLAVALCRYLLLQGYEPTKITILATYVGQLYLIKRLAKDTVVKGVRCTVVDNYQGEENDIIILSLVRSNVEGMVGFLRVENRVCVALSRARDGLYCVGNFDMLADKSDLWRNLVDMLERNGRIGPSLTLACQNHPNQRTEVSDAADFERVPEGGCNLPCEYRLECGHRCPKACHNYDREHTEMKCTKPCERSPDGCPHQHKCPKQCHELCGKCFALVPKELPRCGHINDMSCYRDPLTFACVRPCSKELSCGHTCTKRCSDTCESAACIVLVKVIASCGHQVLVQCNKRTDTLALLDACRNLCLTILECGHRCGGNCSACHQGRFHQRCSQKCDRLQVCGHPCKVTCAANCPPCTKPCENRCEHSKCPVQCGVPCQPCVEPCAWRCEHLNCTLKCHEACDRPPCDQPCPLPVPGENSCGHPCIGLCGETCPPFCRICQHDQVCEIFLGNEDEEDARYIYLEDCKHLFEVRDLDQWMSTNTESTGGGAEEGHLAIAMKTCPRCKTVIRRNARYGGQIKRVLNDVIDIKRRIFGDVRNSKKDLAALKAQVEERIAAADAAAAAREADGARAAADGPLHNRVRYDRRGRLVGGGLFNRLPPRRPATDADREPPFFAPCLTDLRADVGSQPNMSRSDLNVLRTKFEFLKRLDRIWNDVPDAKCRDMLLPISLRHDRQMPDDPLRDKLAEMRRWWLRSLPKNESSEHQLRDYNRELQRLTVLSRFMSSVKYDITNIQRDGGALFTAFYGLLTGRQPFSESVENKIEQLWIQLKEHVKHLNYLPGLEITRKEADAIQRALNLGQGHWYKCPNGHLYTIGECGGAMQMSRCIECRAPVGGTNHHVVAGNQFTNELDGATRPANPFYRDEAGAERFPPAY